jgi:hypothetical protein
MKNVDTESGGTDTENASCAPPAAPDVALQVAF